MRAFLLLILLVASVVIATKGYQDFNVYYSVSAITPTGEFHRIYGVPNDVGGFFYTPVSLVLFAPLRWLSQPWAHRVWIGFNAIAYLVFWFYLIRLFPLLRHRFWPWLLVWIVAIKPIHASFQCSNMQLMYAALFAAAYYWTLGNSRRFKFLGGFLVALAAVMKLYPLFLAVYFLVRAPRETKWGVGAGIAAGILIPFAYFGPQTAGALFTLFAAGLSHFHDYAPLTKDAVTLSLPSLVATWGAPSLGMPLTLKIITGLGAAISGIFFWTAWRRKPVWGTEAGVAEWSLALAVMTLVNSTTRPDYFVYFVPGFAVLALAVGRERRAGMGLGLATSVLLISFISEWSLGSRALNHALELLRIPVLGMIALCATLAAWVGTSALANRDEEAVG